MWTLTTALFQTLHNSGAAIATIPLIFVFFFFYDVAYTPMLVSYTLEILPYSIRAKGFAVMVCFPGLLMLTISAYMVSVEHDCLPDERVQSVCQPLGSRCYELEICMLLV